MIKYTPLERKRALLMMLIWTVAIVGMWLIPTQGAGQVFEFALSRSFAVFTVDVFLTHATGKTSGQLLPE